MLVIHVSNDYPFPIDPTAMCVIYETSASVAIFFSV